MEHNEDNEWRQKNSCDIAIAEKGRKRTADCVRGATTSQQIKDNSSQKHYYIVKKPPTQD